MSLIPSSPSTRNGDARCYEPSSSFRLEATLTKARYAELYRESLEAPDTFWKRETSELVFRKPWHALLRWEPPHAQWFLGARLNITESCLDRHLDTPRRDQAALIWEAESGETRTLTYAQLHDAVVRLAGLLRGLGIATGDRVAIYMGMVPEAVVAMLACARIGAPHTVVFGGFAAEALRERIKDSGAKLVITQDGALRRGQVVPLKAVVDEAVEGTASVEKVLVYRRLGSEVAPVTIKQGRDLDWATALAELNPSADGSAEIVDAEHPLFILYTSGSTGKPKGVLHTTAGYLAGTHVTTKYVFDLKPSDVYFCTADIGWITGHSYIVYGPLSNGATCLLYEGAPNHPDWGRFWQIVQKHRVSILYTAPTAIRAFMRQGAEWPSRYDLSSLRLLGSVGEPINPEAWVWYYENIGRGRCPIVDTWWQTETGAIMLTTLPGAHAMKPGSAGLPLFGVEPAIVATTGERAVRNQSGALVLKRPWPSMLRNVWGAPQRYAEQYWSPADTYVTGDGASCDEDGYYCVTGRIDDVLNVSGHRIGTAEIESALVSHRAVAEAAAVGRDDALKGQALVVFVTLKPGFEPDALMKQTLAEHVAREIGKLARPDEVRFAESLPKTRSGKILRRLLKDVAAGRATVGDLSTLEDPNVLARLHAEAP